MGKRSSDAPKFVYWLTLSSHFPLDYGYARELGIEKVKPHLPDAPESIVCHEAILAGVIREIADLAGDSRLDSAHFLLVGDHPPPFTDPGLRAEYESKRVPFLYLRPISKSVGNAPNG